jgi:hypothetical protein
MKMSHGGSRAASQGSASKYRNAAGKSKREGCRALPDVPGPTVRLILNPGRVSKKGAYTFVHRDYAERKPVTYSYYGICLVEAAGIEPASEGTTLMLLRV